MPSARAAAGSGAEGRRAEGWGRYTVYGAIASGGMATIDYGRLIGPHGFSREVVIKRLHPHLAKDPELVAMLVDEARLSSRVRHANVIATLDVIEAPGELALVMEYVHGVSLADLIEAAGERGERMPVGIAVALVAGALHGLHAAHEALDEEGEPLQIVHRDISPQNVLVGADGIARVIDFGIAKAKGRLRTTADGQIKGTLAYIAPEQLRGDDVDPRSDVYSAAAVLWEALCGRPLFDAPNEPALLYAVVNDEVLPPSRENSSVPEALDRVVLRGLSRERQERFVTARDMARALEQAVGSVPQSAIAEWVQHVAGEQLAVRARFLQRLQANSEAVESEVRPVRAVEPGTRPIAVELVASPAASAGEGIEERRENGPSRRWLVWALVAVCLVVAGAVSLSTRGGRPAAGTIAPVPAPTPTPAATPVPAPAPAIMAPIPIPEPEPNPPPQRKERAAPRSALRSEKPAGEPAPVPRARNCVPPYVIDRQGVRHYKPECL